MGKLGMPAGRDGDGIRDVMVTGLHHVHRLLTIALGGGLCFLVGRKPTEVSGGEKVSGLQLYSQTVPIKMNTYVLNIIYKCITNKL